MRVRAPRNVAHPRSADAHRAIAPPARACAARVAALAGFAVALLAPAPSRSAEAAPPAAEGAQPSMAARSVAVVDAWVGSEPPTLGVLVTERAIARARALGYTPLDPLVVRRAHVSLQRPGRLDATALAAVASRSGAALALVVSVEPTERGEQRVTIESNDASGSRPRAYSLSTTVDDIGGTVDQLVRAVLPEVPAAASPPAPPPAPPRAPEALAPHESAHPPPQPWRLALALDTAFGLPGDGFRNHLLGPRLDRRFSETVSLGLAISYANLTGPSGRVGNFLPALSLEWRPPLTRQVAAPLRYTGGYLRNNGPVVQLAVGLSVVTGSVELAFLPVAPTLWVTKDQPVVSLDLLAELGTRF